MLKIYWMLLIGIIVRTKQVNFKHALNVASWEHEIHLETWSRVKPFGVKVNSYEYNQCLRQMADEDWEECLYD